MTNVLTDDQAANFIRSSATDPVMLQLLPLVDEYLKNATGHDWASDVDKHNTAVTAAGMLLIAWYDNPSMIGQTPVAVRSTLMQLEAEALKYRKYEIAGMNGAGAISVPGARQGDVVMKLIGTYGVSGDQSASFEAIVSEDNQLQQTSSSDLSEKLYVVVLKHPADNVSA